MNKDDELDIEKRIIDYIQKKLINELYYDDSKNIYIYKPIMDNYNLMFPDKDAVSRVINKLFKSAEWQLREQFDNEKKLFVVKLKEKPFLYLKFGRVKININYDKNITIKEIEESGSYSMIIYVELFVLSLDMKIISSGFIKLFEVPIMIGSNIDKIMYKRLNFGNIFYFNGKYRALGSLLVKTPNKFIVKKGDYKENVIVDYGAFKINGSFFNNKYYTNFLYYSNVRNSFLIHQLHFNYDLYIEVSIVDKVYRFPLLPIYFILGGTPKDLYEKIIKVVNPNGKIILNLLAIFEEYNDLVKFYNNNYRELLNEILLYYFGEEKINFYEETYGKSIVNIFLEDWFLSGVNNKKMLIEFLIMKLLHYSDKDKEDEEDNFKYYKILTPSELIFHTINYAIRTFIKNMIKDIERAVSKKHKEAIKKVLKSSSDVKVRIIHKILNIYTLSDKNSKKVQKYINNLFVRGIFSSIYGEYQGLSFVVDITNKISVYSSILKVVHFSKVLENNEKYRSVNSSQYGKLCPIDTPEGQNVGLNLTLAIYSTISYYRDLNTLGVFIDYFIRRAKNKDYYIILNGEVIGLGDRDLYYKLIELKDRRKIFYDISIELNDEMKYIEIFSTNGQLFRYIFRMKNGKLKLLDMYKKYGEDIFTFDIEKFVDEGCIDIISYEDEDNNYIVFYSDIVNSVVNNTNLDEVVNSKYCEISDYSFLGLTSLIIPFSNHNASPRNVMGVKQSKQALSNLSNDLFYNDTFKKNYRLVYSQYPIVKTVTDDFIKDKYGINVVVAVISDGYNMQDAIVINKASIERGLFLAEYTDTIQSVNISFEKIVGKSLLDYFEEEGYKFDRSKFDEHGIIKKGQKIKRGDIIFINPIYRFFENKEKRFTFYPKIIPNEVKYYGEEAIVLDTLFEEKKLMSISGKNKLFEIKKLRIYDLRQIEFGDKLSTRHGQKGVIGFIKPQEDLPFTESGIIPDIVINPHSIPSRMTIGQLLEMLSGKNGALKIKRVNGTVFYSKSEEEIRNDLVNLGYNYNGKEYMYDGITGRKFKAMILTGVIYYMRLKHFVKDKIQYRNIGKNNLLTGEPVKGKQFGGGIRMGEMEVWSLLGHGAVSTLKERLYDNQEKRKIIVCAKCGAVLNKYDKKGNYVCYNCGNNKDFYELEVSKQFLLMLNELKALGINLKLDVRKVKDLVGDDKNGE